MRNYIMPPQEETFIDTGEKRRRLMENFKIKYVNGKTVKKEVQ